MADSDPNPAQELLAQFVDKLREERVRRRQGSIQWIADELGVSRSSIEKWLKGEGPLNPAFETVISALHKFGIALDARSADFICGSRGKFKPSVADGHRKKHRTARKKKAAKNRTHPPSS